MSDWFEEGTTMLFIGDSITDCGRRGAEAHERARAHIAGLRTQGAGLLLLLLLGISHPLAPSVVVPKPPTAPIPYTPSTPLLHLRLLVLRQ